jgi:hypothetical protein
MALPAPAMFLLMLAFAGQSDIASTVKLAGQIRAGEEPIEHSLLMVRPHLEDAEILVFIGEALPNGEFEVEVPAAMSAFDFLVGVNEHGLRIFRVEGWQPDQRLTPELDPQRGDIEVLTHDPDLRVRGEVFSQLYLIAPDGGRIDLPEMRQGISYTFPEGGLRFFAFAPGVYSLCSEDGGCQKEKLKAGGKAVFWADDPHDP